MQTQNPYNAPRAQVADAPSNAYGGIRIFTSRGRIGRLRYIAYTTGLPMLIMLLIGVVGGMLGGAMGQESGPAILLPIMVAAYLAILVMVVFLTIQRSHDFNASGWMALVMLIPLVNLIFWFIPGTDGENRFGLRPPPNGLGVAILGLLLPVVFVIGIIAAVALPAYQDYVNRAKAQQQSQ